MGRSGDNAPIVDIEGSLVSELQKLDLTLNEARILIFLMTHGHSSASDISRHTGIQRTETYNYISGLLSKGIIFSTFDRPQKYYSLPLEEVVDSLVQAKMNELGVFETKKKEYHDMIEALVGNRVVKQDDKERYNVVMGENAINARIGRMLAEVKEEVLILVTDRNLVNFYHAGITDQFIQLTAKGVYVNLRTPCKNVGDYISQGDVKLKTTEKMVPTSFVIVDGRELMILLESQPFKKSEQCCFYTNNLSLVSVFKFLFDSVM